MIGKFRINIIVPDSFPQKNHNALIRSAEQCAVAKHVQKTLPGFVTRVLTQSEVE